MQSSVGVPSTRKMKGKTAKLILALILVGTGISVIGLYSSRLSTGDRRTVQVTKSGPETVVERFCDLSRGGEFEELRQYITDYPDTYFRSKDQEIVLYKKVTGQFSEAPEVETVQNPGEVEIVDMPGLARRTTTLIADEDARRFFRDSLYIKEIKNVWIKNAQARVRVQLGSQSLPSYLALQDFLLYNDGGWKVFHVDDSYGYNVYGVPDGEIEAARGD